MQKKFLIIAMALVVLVSVVLTACGKPTYTDPQTGKEYLLVVDEDGNKVLSDDGELLVYVTEENGKIQKDENGVPVSEIHGFIGQIVEDGIVEDYAYKFTIPQGWKTTDKFGIFENKSLNAKLEIDIKEQTFNDYMNDIKHIDDTFTDEEYLKEYGKGLKYSLEECDYNNVDSKVYFLSIVVKTESTCVLFFQDSGNTYQLRLTASESSASIEELESELFKIYESMEFKERTYYEDLTDEYVEKSTTEVVSE